MARKNVTDALENLIYASLGFRGETWKKFSDVAYQQFDTLLSLAYSLEDDARDEEIFIDCASILNVELETCDSVFGWHKVNDFARDTLHISCPQCDSEYVAEAFTHNPPYTWDEKEREELYILEDNPREWKLACADDDNCWSHGIRYCPYCGVDLHEHFSDRLLLPLISAKYRVQLDRAEKKPKKDL